MGVNGLWKLLEPVGRPITLESLANKTLAVDVSVWLNQALYGMRNQHGSSVPNAHLVLLFQRICKLLYYGVKPIFVFDGGIPELKKKTMTARRAMRLSARNKAQKVSENVLKKYLKSRAIGSVTGRRSQRSSIVQNQPEPEKDLFELPPLPEEKDAENFSDNEYFFQSPSLQNTEDVNIDSEEFKKLPHEIQHEIVVEMHEKSKRHSRYQDIDMPERSDDFSEFQLNHLLKRGKLTQRLGTIRKEMNEKRAGELVTDMSDSGLTGNSIIQAQKIMSEESSHYILIKRTESRKKDDDHEQEEDNMAGGFFRENNSDNEVELQPVVLTDLPKVPRKVAEPSVSLALDEATSSAGESSDEHQFEDVDRDSEVLPDESADVLMIQSNNDTIPQISITDHPSAQESVDLSSAVSTFEQFTAGEEDKLPSDAVRKQSNSDSLISDRRSTDENGRTLGEGITAQTINNANFHVEDSVEKGNGEILGSQTLAVSRSSKQASTSDIVSDNSNTSIPTTGSITQTTSESEKTISTFDTELDDLEDEINHKKRLIEKLLSGRRPSTMANSHSMETVENVQEETSCSRPPFLDIENDIVDSPANDISDSETTRPTENDIFRQNEFEGKTCEELGEMQMKLDEDLDNLKEERSRQTRLAATVTDEMYKDSQELLQLFGIPFVVSPMEAEAQCATLNRNDMCDGSITEDSDIILFGGKKVYKNVFNQKRHAELYQEDDVKCVLGLDRLNLIAIALLTGSDYTEGVKGVGIVSAMEIINEFSGEGIEKLQNLKNWLDDISKHQLHESQVKNKLRNISLPIGFPSQPIFEAYLNPAVDDSREAFSWANPDLHSLRLFASEKLGWSKTKADEILLPVMKRLNSKETQSKIDAFFPVQFNETRKIKSRRMKRIVNRLLDKDDDDAEKQTLKKRKVRGSTGKSKKIAENHKESSGVGIQEPDNASQCTSSPVSKTMSEHKPRGSEKTRSSSDSTSDTSDEDQSYVPFNTKAAPPRCRGMPRSRSGVSGSRGARRTGTNIRKKIS